MSKLPAINQKLAIRGVICLFLLAGLVLGYNWIRSLRDPDDFSRFDSAGMILAVQSKPKGSEVVIIQPGDTNKILECPGYSEGKVDRDATWRPDGAAVLFSSDRDTDTYNIYRWNLMRGLVQRRSLGTRSQLAARFSPASLGGPNDACLITAGGTVQEFMAHEAVSQQVLPPLGRGASKVGNEETGPTVSGQFESAYQSLGSSFREARWGKDMAWVVAVMRSEYGEVLVLQSMDGNSPPLPVVTGDRVDFDICPKTGEVAFTVVGYKRVLGEDASKETRLAAKQDELIRHRLGVVDPSLLGGQSSSVLRWVFGGTDDKSVLTSPAFSPDGSTIMAIQGSYEGSGNIKAERLVTVPPVERGITRATVVAIGEIYTPSWSPTGDRIVYIRRVGKERAVCTSKPDGAEEKNLTEGKGDFSNPSFSPQVKGR